MRWPKKTQRMREREAMGVGHWIQKHDELEARCEDLETALNHLVGSVRLTNFPLIRIRIRRGYRDQFETAIRELRQLDIDDTDPLVK